MEHRHRHTTRHGAIAGLLLALVLQAAPAATGSLRPLQHLHDRPQRRLYRQPMGHEQRAFARAHLGLAHQQARRFSLRHGLAYEDLLGPAYEGLCKAAIGFDAHRGHRPSSYIVPKVKGELLHHLRDTGFALRISHRLRELWMKARRPLALGLGDREIAEQLGVSLAEWLDCRQACGQRPLSFEELGREV